MTIRAITGQRSRKNVDRSWRTDVPIGYGIWAEPQLNC